MFNKKKHLQKYTLRFYFLGRLFDGLKEILLRTKKGAAKNQIISTTIYLKKYPTSQPVNHNIFKIG